MEDACPPPAFVLSVSLPHNSLHYERRHRPEFQEASAGEPPATTRSCAAADGYASRPDCAVADGERYRGGEWNQDRGRDWHRSFRSVAVGAAVAIAGS